MVTHMHAVGNELKFNGLNKNWYCHIANVRICQSSRLLYLHAALTNEPQIIHAYTNNGNEIYIIVVSVCACARCAMCEFHAVDMNEVAVY